MSDEDINTTYGYEVGQRCVSSEVPFAWINVHIIYPNYITCSVAVYAYQKGRRGVDESDLWYGKIESLRVDKRAKASQVCAHKQLTYHGI